jgi:hypothetical protein
MLRSDKEEALAKELYDTINGEVNKETIRTALFSVLRLNNKGRVELNNRFQRFYMNKMLYRKKKKSIIEPSYTPTLNPNSIILAERSRERKRLLMQTTGDVEESKNAITEMLLNLRKSIRNQEEALNRSKTTRNNTMKDKCISLYKLSRTIRRQFDRTTEEVEYEKAKNELTFSPKVPKYI